jgi:UDPglucose 6-dehydrogenase
MDVRSAELTKYAANAMLATKISFMNELAQHRREASAPTSRWCAGHRLRSAHRLQLHLPGRGYGGSCFPKDVQALARTARRSATRCELLEAVEAVNDAEAVLFEKMLKHFGGEAAGKHVRAVGPGVQAEHRRHARGLEPRC